METNLNRIWAIYFSVLPWAFFAFNQKVSLYHAQTLWGYGGAIILWALSLQSATKRAIPNWPLSIWMIWIAMLHLWIIGNLLSLKKDYPIVLPVSLWHHAIIPIIYYAAISTWNSGTFKLIAKYMAFSSIVLIVYAVLQLLSLDQFFHHLDKHNPNDELVGMMGNPTLFGSHLAFFLPWLLEKETLRWKLISLAIVIFVLFSKSFSAWLSLSGILLWWSWFRSRRIFYGVIFLIVIGVGYLCLNPTLLNPYGRIEAWQEFYKIFSSNFPITGLGVGFVWDYVKSLASGPLYRWTQVHNEYLQIAIEQGLIGLAIVFWAILDAAHKLSGLLRSDIHRRVAVTLGGIGIAFLLNSLVLFPAHRFVLASFGLIAYCGIYALHAEVSR